MKNSYNELIAIILSALVLTGGLSLIWSCGSSTPTPHTVVESAGITADACKGIAELHGRDDIAGYCEVAGGVASVIDLLLSEAEQAKTLRAASTECVVVRDAGVDALDDRK